MAPRPSVHLETRRVRLRLQGKRLLEGDIHISAGQSLVGFLGLRSRFLNLTSVRWLDGEGGDRLPHVGIRVSRIVWVVPLDPDLPLTSARLPAGPGREIQLDLVDRESLRVTLGIADEQRMSDYFDANPTYIPLRSARIAGSTEVVERLVVHHEAIVTVREL